MKLAMLRSGIVLLVVLLQSCGGGGGGNAGGPPAGPNRPPTVGLALSNQRLISFHPFNFDVSQGGRSFTDPDGDRLSYAIVFTNPAPPGLVINGTVISGTPTAPGSFSASIRVTDGRGGEILAGILIDVIANSPPVVVNANPDQVLSVTEFFDREVTSGGTVFADADGDRLSYQVTFAAGDRGLSINGTRVSGMMNSAGMVRVRVVARDGFGGEGEDAFSIALPSSINALPNLPTPSYIYADEELNLPYLYQLSRQIAIPFEDTTSADNAPTNAGATLGRVLFYDKRLSITNTVACASCHLQANGFASFLRFNIGTQETLQSRNAMSLGNVRYNGTNLFFWDERVNTLEALIPIPIENSVELGHPMQLLLPKLAATNFYPPLFEAAFGSPEITSNRIARAISQFLRAMISYRAKSDQAFLVRFEGDIPDPSLVFNALEMRGLTVASESGCFGCHASDVLNVVGARNNGLDLVFTDPGVGRGQFRPPSLKNIRVTAPYMHDGRFATLREVINFYDQDVQDTPHLDSLLRDPLTQRPRRLNLSEADKDALEAFLDTLTDVAFLTDPRFSDPFPE